MEQRTPRQFSKESGETPSRKVESEATGQTSLILVLNEIEQRANAATAGPWKKCSASEGKCVCHDVWSVPADAPVCSCNDKWGDHFASLRFVGNDGPGTIGAKVEAYEDMIEYGNIGEDAKQANKDFIASARQDVPRLVKALRILWVGHLNSLRDLSPDIYETKVNETAQRLAAILTSPENGNKREDAQEAPAALEQSSPRQLP